MTDNICHSILKTATQQIIQSAGFESANNHSIETLADVFARYIEFLGSSVSAYANLNGRSMGNIKDLLASLEDVSMDTVTLKNWLEEEGKSLTPCWSAQSDPGRLLQGVVSGGRPSYEDKIEYRYGDIEEFELISPPRSPLAEPSSPSPPILNESLPDYIPPYFPSFPEIKEDVVMDEVDKILLEKQKQIEEQKQKQLKLKEQSSETLPLPVIVKKRKKPIDNPFTHIIPFEDSTLASEPEEPLQPLQKPLSLLLDDKGKQHSEQKEEETAARRRQAATGPLSEALRKLQRPTYPIGEGLANEDRLFVSQAQQSAAPGSHLFNSDSGLLDDLVRHRADPLAISKLTAPNLLIDVATLPSPTATPLQPTFEFPSQPTSPEGPLKTSRSMLAVLASGPKKKLPKSGSIPPQPVSLNAFISKSSIDINSIKTGDSKYIIKKKRMIAEQALKRQQQEEGGNLEEPRKKAANLKLNVNAVPTGEDSTTSSPSTPKIRFKIKAPEPKAPAPEIKVEKPTYQLHLYQQPSPVPVKEEVFTEEIRCICENPTVDYGAFMIACDRCSVWFHGSCVGIAESDQVEEWYCKRCKRKLFEKK